MKSFLLSALLLFSTFASAEVRISEESTCFSRLTICAVSGYLGLGEFEKATSSLGQAIEADPLNVDARRTVKLRD